jgi:flagellar hook-basal body complex protein FliE
MATPLVAANAYAAAARLAANAPGAVSPAAGTSANDATSFAALLKEAIGTVADMGHKADAKSRDLVNGRGNMVDVVTAVAEAEVAIDAVVAVRDKVIAAYDEIMKMPI